MLRNSELKVLRRTHRYHQSILLWLRKKIRAQKMN